MNKTPNSPSWVKDLIIYQLRIDTFTDEGTFNSAKNKMEYLNELGINAIWLAPIYEPSSEYGKQCESGRFCNFDVKEPNKLFNGLGSEQDFKEFVQEAHNFGIKIILEIVPHGVTFNSDLVKYHSDWFKKDDLGDVIGTWGMADFDWTVVELREWWVDMATQWVLKFDIDGFRCDLEPHISGYSLWKEVREKLEKKDREFIIFSELENNREFVFNFEQVGVGNIHPTQGSGDYLHQNHIVDVIKNGLELSNKGQETYYTYAMSVHDSFSYKSNNSPVKWGYDMLFAPFIPIFYNGEEFENSVNIGNNDCANVMFFNNTEWVLFNQDTFDMVRNLIKIKKENSDILNISEKRLIDTKIEKIKISESNILGYARYNDNAAILVIANNGDCNRWEPKIGNWNVEYGLYSQDNKTDEVTQSILKNYEISDETIEVSMNTLWAYEEKNESWGGIEFRKQNNYSEFGSGAYSLRWSPNKTLRLCRDNKILAQVKTLNSPQHIQTLIIELKGRVIKVYEEGVKLPAIVVKDDTYKKGYLGLGTYALHVHFNSLKLHKEKLVENFIGEEKNVTFDISKKIFKFNRFKAKNIINNEKVDINSKNQISLKIKGNDISVLRVEECKNDK